MRRPWRISEALRHHVDDAGDPADDPFDLIIGLVADAEGLDDVALNHDHYLYGAAKADG